MSHLASPEASGILLVGGQLLCSHHSPGSQQFAEPTATNMCTLPVGVCIENVLNLPGLASVFPMTQLQQVPFASLGICSCCCPIFCSVSSALLSGSSTLRPVLSWPLQGCIPQHIFLTNTAKFGKCRYYRSPGIWMSYPLGGIGPVSG